jgi:hypothetical protein
MEESGFYCDHASLIGQPDQLGYGSRPHLLHDTSDALGVPDLLLVRDWCPRRAVAGPARLSTKRSRPPGSQCAYHGSVVVGRAVAKLGAHVRDGRPLREQERCEGMPEVVHAEARELYFLEHGSERASDSALIDKHAEKPDFRYRARMRVRLRCATLILSAFRPQSCHLATDRQFPDVVGVVISDD